MRSHHQMKFITRLDTTIKQSTIIYLWLIHLYVWKKEFVAMFECNFYFSIDLPKSKFTFTHHVKPIIKEVNSYKDIHVAFDAMAIEVYDGPSPS